MASLRIYQIYRPKEQHFWKVLLKNTLKVILTFWRMTISGIQVYPMKRVDHVTHMTLHLIHNLLRQVTCLLNSTCQLGIHYWKFFYMIKTNCFTQEKLALTLNLFQATCSVQRRQVILEHLVSIVLELIDGAD